MNFWQKLMAGLKPKPDFEKLRAQLQGGEPKVRQAAARELGKPGAGASPPLELRREDGYTLSTDPARLDLRAIHRYLSEESYWARGRSYETVCQAAAHSLCFGVYAPDGEQAGLARVVTDYATFAWLCDVFILPAQRGRGLGKWLVETAVGYPPLAAVRRYMLATSDAHELYRRYGGFTNLSRPEKWMERVRG